VIVRDDFQNLGLGMALVDFVVSIARMKGLKKVYLLVNADNARGIHVYEVWVSD